MLFLLKVFEKEEYADDLLDGNLFLNTLSYFKELDSDEGNRGDSSEGVVQVIKSDFVEITSPSGKVLKAELASPLVITRKWGADTKVYCMYLMNYSEVIGPDTSESTLINQTVNKLEALKFGQFGVVILDLKRFLKMVVDAAEAQGYLVGYRPITYYSDGKIDLMLSSNESIFHKSEEFAYQSEFRIVLKKDDAPKGPLRLNIGSLEGLAVKIDMTDLKNTFRFELVEVVETEQIYKG